MFGGVALLAIVGAALIPGPASADGCRFNICGRVINNSDSGIKVMIDWGHPSSIRSLGAHRRLGGNDIDVDAFGVPPRCTATVNINHGGSSGALLSGGNTDFRYYKIRTDQTAVITSLRCRGG
jgi:hypothetical protein